MSQPSTSRIVLDNRLSYLGFGAAWLVGHGATALANGENPLVAMPSALPSALLVGGMLVAMIVTGVVSARAQRGATGSDAVVGNLLAASWAVGFGALFIVITALSSALNNPAVESLLWPAGSGLVVGLLYLAGGSAYRDVQQYALGSRLALISAAALFLGGVSAYWLLALAGGGAYLLAAALEPRRRAAVLAERRRCAVAVPA
ncbi:ABC transporter permease [Nocardia crassostreae]|uniref:ABC transporter permease n=1 Tax=Nocardia crassostreae TaxID=53428 RepID=UPI000836D366|nr:ABC transporter permease [Nocardia crassostreae]